MIGQIVSSCVADSYGCTVLNIKGEQRQWCQPRWIVMLILHELGWSYPRIGRFLGDRDHTTIMHGVTRARELLEANHIFKHKYQQTVSLIGDVEYTA